MAMQNDYRLPEWFRAESYRGIDFVDWRFRVAVRCKDADVKIFDIEEHAVNSPGRSPRLDMTKLQLLQLVHEQITIALAKATLEQE